MNYTCFAYKKGECRALNDCICYKGKCSFFKTDAERAEGLRKSEDRIRSLDPNTVRYISDKYYKSKL